MKNVLEFQKVFASEIAQIGSAEIQDFIMMCINSSCQDYFFEKAASSTGKYHPALSLGPGGIVRHTKYAFWWANELIRAANLDDESANIVRGAILIHDMMKRGYNYDEAPAKINQIHGRMLVNDIISKLPKDFTLTETHVYILNAVDLHMGIWTDPRPQFMSRTAEIVHLADYIASRKVEPVIEMLTNEASEASLNAVFTDCSFYNDHIADRQTTIDVTQPPCRDCDNMNCPINPHRH